MKQRSAYFHTLSAPMPSECCHPVGFCLHLLGPPMRGKLVMCGELIFLCAMVSKASHQIPFLLPAAQGSSAVAPGSGTLSPVTGMTPDSELP